MAHLLTWVASKVSLQKIQDEDFKPCSNCRQMCLNITKPLMISPNCYDITQLLLLMIIVNSKTHTIQLLELLAKIIDNISINRQNQLTAHP